MNERPQIISGRLDEEADSRKLTFSEDARVSGKEPMTEKAKFIINKLTRGKITLKPDEERTGPELQNAIVTHDLLGGKIASIKYPHASAVTDMVATKDHEFKPKSIRKVEYSMLGTLTRKDGYNKITKGILTGNILKKPGLPITKKV